MTVDRQARRQAWRRGLSAEDKAAWLLRFKGYRILARRWRCPAGEIDLIARRGKLLIFVEVKARQAPSLAAEAIGPRQQERLRRAAESYLALLSSTKDCMLRFDCVLLAPGRWPRHLKDAFR